MGNKVVPKMNYHSKYEHLIGLDSAIDAAKKTETNAQYGWSVQNKRRTGELLKTSRQSSGRRKNKKWNILFNLYIERFLYSPVTWICPIERYHVGCIEEHTLFKYKRMIRNSTSQAD